MPPTVPIATRKSALALEQTRLARAWLERARPEAAYGELPLSTRVDERLGWSLEKRGGIGLFTKELEEALLEGRAGLAVHSAKDLPVRARPGLAIAGYLPRARANDVLVRRAGCAEPETIATGSPRRRAQIARRFPHARWATLRGNVGTRLRKIAEGAAEATLLAAAGLDRLGIDAHPGLEFEVLPLDAVVPAPGQAAIAVQCREEDLPGYAGLFDAATAAALAIERGLLRRLGGGCQTPVGAHYADGAFHIFHPRIGHRRFDFDLPDEAAATDRLDAVFDRLREEGFPPAADEPTDKTD